MVFDPISQAEYDDPDNKAIKTIVPILEEFSRRPEPTKNRRLHILFRKSPVALKGNEGVERIVLETNDLVGEPLRVKAKGSGHTEELDCGLVLRSVGYRGLPIPGVPFDEESGRIANRDGRVVREGNVVPGMYAVGWIKRGPSGVIGTNKPDSQATVEKLLEDVDDLAPCETPDSEALENLLKERGIRVVTFEDWTKIDQAEIARGARAGKPREKFTRLEEILNLLDGV